MAGSLENKVALVLGAGAPGNMGQAIARRYAREGARLVVSGRNRANLDALAAEIGGVAHPCDITVEDDIAGLARAALARFGRIDIAVDCAGINLPIPFLDTTAADLQRLYDVQFKGAFQFLQAMVRAMIGRGGGSIIQISSAAGTTLLDDYAAYRGTKAGIDQVVRSVADEFGKDGIRANTISPGAVRTPMTEALWQAPSAVALFAESSPLGRIGTVDEIAAAAVWLAQEDCFMTGENLHVSGGLMLRRNPTRDAVASAFAADLEPNPTHEELS